MRIIHYYYCIMIYTIIGIFLGFLLGLMVGFITSILIKNDNNSFCYIMTIIISSSIGCGMGISTDINKFLIKN